MGHLDDPRDLARAGQVCQSWKECGRDPSLWRRLPLSQWEFGVWRFLPAVEEEAVDLPSSHLRLATSDEEPQPCQLYDNLASSLLPMVMLLMLSFKDFYETEPSLPSFLSTRWVAVFKRSPCPTAEFPCFNFKKYFRCSVFLCTFFNHMNNNESHWF